MSIEITADVSNALGFYVYAYIDPRDNSVFYIGKGVGSRAVSHLFDKSESSKVARIKNIIEAGFEPRIDILAYQLRDDLEASRVESALIELMGINNLTNIVKGRYSNNFPRRQLTDIIIENNPAPAEITDSALLIRINKQFKYGISAQELYESTRGVWVIGQRRNRANFAMAVYAGVIREVYEIDSWHRAGTTEYLTRDKDELAKYKLKRWEFIGKVASDSIRSRYIGFSVAHLFRIGQQSPVVGVNLDN